MLNEIRYDVPSLKLRLRDLKILRNTVNSRIGFPPNLKLRAHMERIFLEKKTMILEALRDMRVWDFYNQGEENILEISIDLCHAYANVIDPFLWHCLIYAMECLEIMSREEPAMAYRRFSRIGKGQGSINLFSDHIIHAIFTCMLGENLLESECFGKTGMNGTDYMLNLADGNPDSCISTCIQNLGVQPDDKDICNSERYSTREPCHS